MFRKRGLSSIVATLIIILITLVAIGILWVVVKNVLQKGSEQIETGQYTLDLQIKSAVVQDGNVTVVVVRRNPGEGEFIGMNFIFFDGQNTEIIRQNISLDELESKTFILTLTQLNTSNLQSISVAPIFRLNSGTESTGNPSEVFSIRITNTGTGDLLAEGNFFNNGFSGVGQVEYSVSGGNLPKFKKAIVDPLDVAPGGFQTFTINVYSPNGIENVTSVTQLDTSTLNLPFQKIGEVMGDEGLEEIWSASWNAYDTHRITYVTTITAKDNLGNQNSMSLSWTDDWVDCAVPVSAHGTVGYEFTSSCSIANGQVGGINGGSFILPMGVTITLQPGSTLILTSGLGWTPTGGSIVTASDHTANIKAGTLWFRDFDQDGIAENATLYNDVVQTFLYVNATLANESIYDCNDQNSSEFQNHTLYVDGDGDGWSNGAGASNICHGTTIASYSYTSAGTDCNEANSSVWTTGYGWDEDGDGYGAETNATACNNGASQFTATLGFDTCFGDPLSPPGPCT